MAFWIPIAMIVVGAVATALGFLVAAGDAEGRGGKYLLLALSGIVSVVVGLALLAFVAIQHIFGG